MLCRRGSDVCTGRAFRYRREKKEQCGDRHGKAMHVCVAVMEAAQGSWVVEGSTEDPHRKVQGSCLIYLLVLRAHTVPSPRARAPFLLCG